jgi:hypothetical protein
VVAWNELLICILCLWSGEQQNFACMQDTAIVQSYLG